MMQGNRAGIALRGAARRVESQERFFARGRSSMPRAMISSRGTLPFLQEGLDAGEQVLALLGQGQDRSPPFRDAGQGMPTGVRFADMATVGVRTPLASSRCGMRFVDEALCRAGALRGHWRADPCGPAAPPSSWSASQHESLLNHAFDNTPSFRMFVPVRRCPRTRGSWRRRRAASEIGPRLGWEIRNSSSCKNVGAAANPANCRGPLSWRPLFHYRHFRRFHVAGVDMFLRADADRSAAEASARASIG